MNGSLIALAELVALAYLTFALGLSATCAGLYPRVRQRLEQWAPADRANWVLAFCTAPAAGALVLTTLCFLPSLGAGWWHLVDHCTVHGSGHPHLCFAHLPKSAGTLVGTGALALLFVVFAALAVEVLRLNRLRHRLQPVIGEGGAGSVIDSPQPLAATIGILRPRVVVSSALRRHLPGELLAAVLEHEQAHVRRRDPLRRMLAHLGSVFHLPKTRQRLLRDLQLACEQACDEQASDRSGDRLLVARALLRVERLLARGRVKLPALAFGFGSAGIISRVEALAGDPIRRAPLWLPAVLCAFLVALVVAADSIHHTTETLLGLVTR